MWEDEKLNELEVEPPVEEEDAMAEAERFYEFSRARRTLEDGWIHTTYKIRTEKGATTLQFYETDKGEYRFPSLDWHSPVNVGRGLHSQCKFLDWEGWCDGTSLVDIKKLFQSFWDDCLDQPDFEDHLENWLYKKHLEWFDR